MRVAVDATYSVDPSPSGIAAYSLHLLDGLDRWYPEDRFLRYFRFKQWLKAPSPKHVWLPPATSLRTDLFHALNQRVDHRLRCKTITTFHDLFVMTGNYSTAEFRKRFTEQAQRAAQNSDFFIAVSEFTAGQVKELLGCAADRIRVIPHGVEQPTGRILPLAEREKIVLFVGALQVRKNLARLVAAFASLPPDWHLIVAGAVHGFGASEILDSIANSPARARIEVKGYVSAEERQRLYGCASIFAFPSLDEGFGMPVLEAMAHGLPVVTSNRSALPEVAGHAAILINPFSSDELASALRRLSGDEGLWQQLHAAGLERARAYTWEAAVIQTYALYSEALASEHST